MALDIRAERQRAHVLLDRLAPAKLGAVCSLLEVIVDDDELTEDDRTAIQAGLDSLKTNGGVPMEDVLADFGLTLPTSSRWPIPPATMARRVIWSTEARAGLRAIDRVILRAVTPVRGRPHLSEVVILPWCIVGPLRHTREHR